MQFPGFRFIADPEPYNRFIEKRLPYRFRLGKIVRKDYWVKRSEKYFVRDELDSKDIKTFERTVRRCSKLPLGKEMTSGEFLRLCALAYNAVFPKDKGLTPVEKYRRHADNRDDGLLDIDPEDPGAFARYGQRRRLGGDCSGGHGCSL